MGPPPFLRRGPGDERRVRYTGLRMARKDSPEHPVARIASDRGPVMIIGGADAHIVVISTDSSLGDLATELYRELFTHMGAGHVSGLRPVTREEANDEPTAAALEGATAVFHTGGNQLRLAWVVSGTRLGAALLEAHQRGVVVAGTSAGASAVSTHMVAFGASGASP